MRRKHPEQYEFDALATYNAEVARGIVHTPEYDAPMREQQKLFDARPIVVSGGSFLGFRTVEEWAWNEVFKK